MKKEFIPKIIGSILTLIFILIFLSFNRGESNYVSQDPEEEIPIAINLIITNELSDFKQGAKLDREIERFMQQWGIKGASLAIMKDEKLVYAKGYGWADQELGQRCEPKHIFRIASLSKLITAVAIMKLQEDGYLDISDRIFLENGPLDIPIFSDVIKDRRIRSITVEDLLRHRGGFSSRYGDPMFNLPLIIRRTNTDSTLTTDQIISYALSQRLSFSPNTGTRYSNLGYLILSRLIEQVTQQSYEEYVKENILKPIGIYDMHLANNYYEERYQNEVRYYEPLDSDPIESYDGSGRFLPRSYGGNNIRGLLGAGGWVASSSELLKLVAAIDGKDNVPDILSQESIEIMTKFNKSYLPIGWSRCTPQGDWTRTGNLAGTSAIIKHNRDGYSWVFITNTSSWKGANFPPEIAQMIRRASNKIDVWPERDLFNPQT